MVITLTITVIPGDILGPLFRAYFPLISVCPEYYNNFPNMSAQEIQENSIDASEAPTQEEVDDVSAPTPVAEEINAEAPEEVVKRTQIPAKRKYTKGPRSEGQKASLIKARAARAIRAAEKSKQQTSYKAPPALPHLLVPPPCRPRRR